MEAFTQPFQVVAYVEAATRIVVAAIVSRAFVDVGLSYVRARFSCCNRSTDNV